MDAGDDACEDERASDGFVSDGTARMIDRLELVLFNVPSPPTVLLDAGSSDDTFLFGLNDAISLVILVPGGGGGVRGGDEPAAGSNLFVSRGLVASASTGVLSPGALLLKKIFC